MLKWREASWLSAGTLWVGVACSAQTPSIDNNAPAGSSASLGDPTMCNTDDDCATGKHCKPVGQNDREFQAEGAMVAPCPYAAGACLTDANCGTGSVCEPFPASMAFGSCGGIVAICNFICSDAPSTARECGEFERCASDGHCVRQGCDDPDFIGCPATMQCDPTYIWNADLNVPRGKYLPFGTVALSGGTLQESTAAETGCVFRRCDDPAGHACLADWRCDLENAEPTTSGCVAKPCEELGHCTNDEYYLCTPTSTERHQDAPDVHGCTYKNCEEMPCSAGYTCDFASPQSDPNGCRVTLCNEPDAMSCAASYTCAPEAPNANAWGCSPSQCDTDGFDCATLNQVCAPDDPRRNIYGCVTAAPPPSATATATAMTNPSASQVVPIGSTTSSVGVNAEPPAPSSPPSASSRSFVGICQ